MNQRRDNAGHINEAPLTQGLQPDPETPEFGGKTPSTAPNTSWETGAGEGATGFDVPATGSIALSNPEVDGPAHAEPYYPPGGDPSVE
jgi:hypothetical protein